jgi:hypothetical protein
MPEAFKSKHYENPAPAQFRLTPAEAKWGKVIGIDSTEKPITSSSPVLIERDRHLFLEVASHNPFTGGSCRMVSIGEGGHIDPAQLRAGETGNSLIEFKTHRGHTIDLTEMIYDRDTYEPALKEVVQNATENYKMNPRAEDRWNSSLKTIWFEGGLSHSEQAFAYIGMPKIDRSGRCNFTLHYAGPEVEVSLSPKQSMLISSPESVTILTLIVNPNNGHYYLVPSHPKFSEAVADKDAVQVVSGRLESPDDVLQRLSHDFSWVKASDFDPPGPHIPLNQVGEGGVEIDKARFVQIYDESLRDSMERAQPNEFEQTYIAVRNYCYAVQLAYLAAHPGEAQAASVSSRLASMGREEKEAMLDSFVAEVTARKRELLLLRRLKEAQLFGMQVPDISPYPKKRYISGETISPDSFLGKYYLRSNTVAMVTDMMRGGDNGLFAEGVDPYELLADVESHEDGHAQKKIDKKEYPWPRSEVWNEWQTVIYPRRLRGQKPSFLSIYQHRIPGKDHNATENQQHGAFELDAMVQELVAKAHGGKLKYKGKRISPDDVERSALASSFSHRERGEFEFLGTQVVGFADLYDAAGIPAEGRKQSYFTPLPARMMGNRGGAFEIRLKGCEDEDYHNRKRKKSDYSHAMQSIEQQFVRFMKSALVANAKQVLGISPDD